MDEIDITGKIGDLFPPWEPPEWPMYSYDRPAYIVWNALANELHKAGWDESAIKDWLQSKSPRWSLDGKLGDDLREIGRRYAREHIIPQTADHQ